MGANGIYGLSGSGLDIDSMVKVGMLSKQNTYDKMYQKEVKNTWIKSAYTEIYSSINSFKEKMATFNKQSTMSAMKANTSNANFVSATANGSAAAMTHKVSVEKLATNAYLLSTDSVERASGANSSYNLSDVAFKSIEAVSGGKYKVTLADDTVKTVDADDKAFTFTVGNGSATTEISYSYKDLVENEKSLYDLASDISDAGLNLTAKYDATTDSFSIYNSTGGEANAISLEFKAADGDSAANAAQLFNNLKLGSSDGDNLSAAKTFTAGSDADVTKGSSGIVKIDGKTYDNLTGNTLTVAGVSYTFNNVSEKDGSGNFMSTSVTVSQDTEAIVENVKSFVEEYNKLLDSLQEKYNESPYSDYKPLTKNQEAQMTESQIKAWNEKAKSGLLYHNSQLRDIISDLREAVYSVVDSVNPVKAADGSNSSTSYNSASALGITSSNTKGHLTLDEEKLRNALSADPDCVYQVFGNLEDDKNGNTDFRNSGIANRLYFIVSTDAMSTIKDYAGTTDDVDDNSYLGNLITNMQTKMSNFKTQMSAYETLLYNKYDAMEVALSKLGTTLSYITG